MHNFRLYLPDQDNPESLGLFPGLEFKTDSGEPKLQRLRSGVSVPTYVARTHEPIRLSRGETDVRFPDGIYNEVGIVLNSIKPLLSAAATRPSSLC